MAALLALGVAHLLEIAEHACFSASGAMPMPPSRTSTCWRTGVARAASRMSFHAART